jgi:hypothetical protein
MGGRKAATDKEVRATIKTRERRFHEAIVGFCSGQWIGGSGRRLREVVYKVIISFGTGIGASETFRGRSHRAEATRKPMK